MDSNCKWSCNRSTEELFTYNRENFKFDQDQRIEREVDVFSLFCQIFQNHISVSTFLKILKALRLEMQVKRFELFREVFSFGSFLCFFFFAGISAIFTVFFISASFPCRATIHPPGCSRFGGTHSGQNGRLSFGAMVCGANSMLFGNKILSYISLDFISVVPKCGVNPDCII